MKIGVIGAGTMGVGIAQVFAQHSAYQVVLCARTQQAADVAKQKIAAMLNKRVASGKLEQTTAQQILDRIIPGCKESLCPDCDLIVETVSEHMETKKQILAELDAICKPDCVFTTNTSSLSITELASGLSHPLAGMHFFNPAPAMKLVEVIAGYHTSAQVLTQLQALATAVGKTPIVVNEAAGFVVNRLLVPMINEAVGIYAEGVSSVKDIDSAMKLGANHPMGPLELGDYIGLDICLAVMEVLYSEFSDHKHRPHPLLKKMVRAGQLGCKSGRGFYCYANGKTPIDEL